MLDSTVPDQTVLDSTVLDSTAPDQSPLDQIIPEHAPVREPVRETDGATDDTAQTEALQEPVDSDAEQNILPLLPDDHQAETLWLPAELMLSRTFALPFAHPRFIDQEILAQDLEERSCEQAEQWWLAWQGARSDAGVAGLMFGLPDQLRQQIDADPDWRSARFIGVDLWGRLNGQLEAVREELTQLDSGNTIALFDADEQGICMGCWRPGTESDGYWSGMRRLNFDGPLEQQISELSGDILQSLAAMGWVRESDPAFGRLPATLCAALSFEQWQGQRIDEDALVSRHEANLDLNSEGALNFRHGIWRTESRLIDLRPWRRTLLLAGALTLVWMGGMFWQNHHLKQQIQAEQQHMVSAFHEGLPKQKVMIDPLAQLRKAAGVQGERGSSGSGEWLRHLAAIAAVYRKTPWTIRKLSFQNGEMSMSGRVGDLQHLNRIRDALQKQSGSEVKLIDTDLSGKQVSFRMAWS